MVWCVLSRRNLGFGIHSERVEDDISGVGVQENQNTNIWLFQGYRVAVPAEGLMFTYLLQGMLNVEYLLVCFTY